MYQIFAHSQFFRPYFIGDIELSNIVFFDTMGEVIPTGHGWLDGTNKKDLNPFTIEKTPVKKRKAQFEKMYADNQPFYMKTIPEDRYHPKNHTLYVPYNPSDWETTDEIFEYQARRVFYKIHTNKSQPFFIKEFIRAEDIVENVEFIKKVIAIGKLMTYSESNLSEGCILENRDKIIAAIKAFSV
jgi:hypothetical protein